MDRQTALRKALRCLRMAASSNPHEAAAALRQARALMDEHGLTELDALAAEVKSATSPTRCRGASLTESLALLVDTVEQQFRCRAVIERHVGVGGKTLVRFYGLGSDPELAAYAFIVLRRQLESDKATHTRRIRKATIKAARGEAFAKGWVAAVRRNLPGTVLDAEHEAQIEAAQRAEHGDRLATQEPRDLALKGKAAWRDSYAGYEAGMGARVHAGVGGEKHRRLGFEGENA